MKTYLGTMAGVIWACIGFFLEIKTFDYFNAGSNYTYVLGGLFLIYIVITIGTIWDWVGK